jgi:hypothetical protein
LVQNIQAEPCEGLRRRCNLLRNNLRKAFAPETSLARISAAASI